MTDERQVRARPRPYGDGADSIEGGPAEDDVVSGGQSPRSRRTAIVIVAIAALLMAEPVWHAISPQAATDSRPDSAAPTVQPLQPIQPSPLASAGVTTLTPPTPLVDGTLPRPRPRGGDFPILRWYRGLPVAAPQAAARAASRPPELSAVFRVRHSDGFTGAEDFAAVAQVRGQLGWVDVVHGDIGPGRLDANGRRVAFKAGLASLTEPHVRSWVYVVSVRRAAVVASLRTPREARVAGWFGPYVVIDRSELYGGPALLDATNQDPPRSLATGVSIGVDGNGDVQLTGDGLVGISPDGRWGVTRDWNWFHRRTRRGTPIIGRPPGRSVETVHFVDARHALIAVRLGGRDVPVLCSLRSSCARLP